MEEIRTGWMQVYILRSTKWAKSSPTITPGVHGSMLRLLVGLACITSES
jgi:hypothetical protein